MGNRKEIHVVPNSDRGGWDAKGITQKGHLNILRGNKMQWIGRVIRLAMMARN